MDNDRSDNHDLLLTHQHRVRLARQIALRRPSEGNEGTRHHLHCPEAAELKARVERLWEALRPRTRPKKTIVYCNRLEAGLWFAFDEEKLVLKTQRAKWAAWKKAADAKKKGEERPSTESLDDVHPRKLWIVGNKNAITPVEHNSRSLKSTRHEGTRPTKKNPLRKLHSDGRIQKTTLIVFHFKTLTVFHQLAAQEPTPPIHFDDSDDEDHSLPAQFSTPPSPVRVASPPPLPLRHASPPPSPLREASPPSSPLRDASPPPSPLRDASPPPQQAPAPAALHGLPPVLPGLPASAAVPPVAPVVANITNIQKLGDLEEALNFATRRIEKAPVVPTPVLDISIRLARLRTTLARLKKQGLHGLQEPAAIEKLADRIRKTMAQLAAIQF